MSRIYLAVALTAVFLSRLDAQLDPVTLSEVTAVRGEVVSVKIPNGPPEDADAVADLSRNGSKVSADVKYGSSRADITIPASIPFGDYLVTVAFPHLASVKRYVASKRLTILPDGKPEIRLSEFDPAATYQREAVYVPDPSQHTSNEVDVESVDIAGAGLTGTSTDIEINGKRVDPIWNDCKRLPPPGNPAEPAVHQIFGGASSTGLRLCRVPVNAAIRANGNAVTSTPVAGSQAKLWEAIYNKGRKIYTTTLTLHGSGFLPSQPQDTVIWVNGSRIEPVWDSCETLSGGGNSGAPVVNQVHGEVLSPNEARVCRVPVPGNGHLLVAAGYGDTRSEARLFQVYRWGKFSVGIFAALIAIVLATIVFLLLFALKTAHIAEREYQLSLLFLDPETNTYSLSKCQFYLWTMAALFGYAYLYLSKVFVQEQGWPDIPSTLPGVIAIGAGTAIGSQFLTGVKGSKGAGDEHPSVADFVTSGGVVAPDRVQMFVWTLFGCAAFCLAVLQKGPGTINELSPVPDGMLYLMGLSSAGYLGGKLARKPGPVISEVSINPPDSDSSLASAQSTELGSISGSVPDFADSIASANMALATLPTLTGTPLIAMTALRNAVSAAGAAHTASELADLLVKLAQLRKTAEDAASDAAAEFTAGHTESADAEAAQGAAAAMQDFTEGITQALSLASIPVIEEEGIDSSTARVIELRGSNLSPEGTFEIDRSELPFRMLRNKEGTNAPEVLTREDGSTLARIIRLTIDPAILASTDRDKYTIWFGENGKHLFTITNPDGQRAELSFYVPPGAAQKTQQ